jgi:polyhydroxyalkanoate synthesis regulator protein
MAMMERAFSMFTPFYRPGETASSSPAPQDAAQREIAGLRDEIEQLRRELAAAKAAPKG